MTILDNPLTLPLRLPLAGLYTLITEARNWGYDKGWLKCHSLETPVISVGNLSVGGSGKTLLAEAICQYLLARGIKVGLLSRGYGRTTRGPLVVSDGAKLQATVTRAGDEAFLLATRLSGCLVVVSEDRFTGARILRESFGVQCIVLDDGFQHRKLGRNLDIVILDTPPEKPGHMLPWGRLRESPYRAARADIRLFSKVDPSQLPSGAEVLRFHYPAFLEDPGGGHVSFQDIPKPFGVFAGLGNPAHFFEAVRRLIGPPEQTLVFPDHAAYTIHQRSRIAGSKASAFVTTAKDAIKLDTEFRKKHAIHVLPVTVDLPESLRSAIDRLHQD